MKIKVTNAAFSKNKNLVSILKNEFPDTEINELGIRLESEALIKFISDADAIIVGLEIINSKILDRVPNLKFISKFGVGLDNIDIDECNNRNIRIGWIGGVNKRSVAEMTLGFMISLIRNLHLTSFQLKSENIWNKNGGMQLSEKTIGIIGIGNIGKEVIKLLKPFNCKILVNDISEINDFVREHNLNHVTKEELYKESDIITLHLPLNDTSINLINKNVFSQMKKHSYIINTSRGGIINESDLKFALKNNIIAGAAIDVYVNEPPLDLELISFHNLICTPHIGGNAIEAVMSMGISAINHLKDYRDKNNIK